MTEPSKDEDEQVRVWVSRAKRTNVHGGNYGRRSHTERGHAEETECMERSELLLFGVLNIVKILNLSF
jgi:hypothetical protein